MAATRSSAGAASAPADRLRNLVGVYIARKRHEISSHPAINEAFKDGSLEKQDSQLAVRRRTSIDVQLRTQATSTSALPSEVFTVYKDVEEERQLFKLAVLQYEIEAPDQLKTNIVNNNTETFQQAFEAAKAIVDDKYEVKGFRDIICRKSNRLFTDSATAISTWANVLPNQSEYFSVLCGGLKLIFGAAARLKKLREDICKAIEEIPDVLLRTNLIVALFRRHAMPETSQLHRHSANIMCSILALLHRIVHELSKSKPFLKRNMRCLLNQEKYGQSLNDAINTLRASVDSFKETVGDYRTAAIMDIHGRVMQVQQDVHESSRQTAISGHNQSANMLALRAGQTTSAQTLNEISQKLVVLDGRLENVMAAVRSLERSPMQKAAIEATLRELVPNLLGSSDRIDRDTDRIREETDEMARLFWRQHSQAELELRGMKVENALVALDYDETVVTKDMRIIMSQGTMMDKTALDRGVVLMDDPKLQQWATIPESSALFVNANCDPTRSPTAFASARLAQSIQESNGKSPMIGPCAFALAFFCEEHTWYKDPDAGPSGLMRSFISQLLLLYRDFSLEVLREIEKIDCMDICSLTEVFEKLVQDLRIDAVVFLIIDNIYAFESKDRYNEEMDVVVESLMRLVQPDNRRAVVKVWMTSDTGSRCADYWFDEEAILVLPEQVAAEDGLAQFEESIPRMLQLTV